MHLPRRVRAHPYADDMWQYRIFDLDPNSDIHDALERYSRSGWQMWGAGRGAATVG